MITEYEYCCLESTIPDPDNANTDFYFGANTMTTWDKSQALLNVRTGNLNNEHGTFPNYGAAIDFLKNNPDLKHDHVPVVTDYDTEAYKTLHKLHKLQEIQSIN